MNINDFEQHIANDILQRGKDYFRKGAIHENQDNGYGSWLASVSGRDGANYTIEIELDEYNSISRCYCDCAYRWGSICKHIVAVLYDIRQCMNGEIIDIDEPKSYFDSFKVKQVLDNMDKHSMKMFIIENIIHFPELREKLLVKHNEQRNILSKADLEKELKTYFKNAGFDYYGYTDIVATKKLKDELNTILKKTEMFLEEKNYASFSDYLETLLEQLGIRFNNGLGNKDLLNELIFSGIELLIRHPKNDQTPDRPFNFFVNSKILFNNEFHFKKIADFLVSRITNQLKAKQFYRWLKDFQFYESKTAKLLFFEKQEALYKFKVIELLEGTKQAILFAEQAKFQNNELLLEVTKFNYEKKNLGEALYLSYHGLDKSEGTTHNSFKKINNELLAALAYKKDIISAALFKVLINNKKKKYYKLLKQYTPEENWENTLNKLIKQLSELKFGVQDLLIHIYIEEQMYYKLFDIVEEAYNPKAALISYAPYLIKSDIDHTGILFTVVIEDLLKDSPNRESYKEIARLLKIMQMHHLQETINLIIESFKENHKRRRALWEELKSADIVDH